MVVFECVILVRIIVFMLGGIVVMVVGLFVVRSFFMFSGDVIRFVCLMELRGLGLWF